VEGKGGRCVGVTNLPPSCADCLEMWEPRPPPEGLSRSVRDCFTFTFCESKTENDYVNIIYKIMNTNE